MATASAAAAYAAGADVEVEKPPKRPAQSERLLSSAVAWGDIAPLFFLGATDGSLRSYVPATGDRTQLRFLRWHAEYKKLYHECARFLDAWGVFATLADARLKLYTLPLQTNPQLEGSGSGSAGLVSREDTKTAVLFAAHEGANVLCVLLKNATLQVLDWTVNRVLEPRAQHDLLGLLSASQLPVQQLVVLSESHIFIQCKKTWVVLHLDSGRLLDVDPAAAARVAEALGDNATGVCDAIALPSRDPQRRRHQIHDLLLCGKQHAVMLTLVATTPSNPADTDDEEDDAMGAFREVMSPLAAAKREVAGLSGDRVHVAVGRVLSYNTAPCRAVYHHPFLLLDQSDRVSVHNFGSLSLVQTLPVKSLYDACAAIDVASAHSTAQTNRARPVLEPNDQPACLFTVAPPFDVKLHQMLPIEQQLAQCLAQGRLEDAVALCQLCPDESPLSDVEQRKLFADYGLMLFRTSSHRRREAMDLLVESRVDVMDVLLLFPRDLLPRKASALRRDKSDASESTVALEGLELVEALLALIGYLRRKRAAFLGYDGEQSGADRRGRHVLRPREERELELIDTMLVKCLVVVAEKPQYGRRAKRALLGVVTGQNWCEIGEAEIFLRAHGRFQALLAFYSARKLHRKALELLEDLERNAAAAVALAGQTKTDDKLQPPPSRDVAGELRTSHEYMVLITQYLRVLGQKHSELVFEFSRRVLSVNPTLGLSIFTQREVPSHKEDVDPAAVLQHLKTCAVAATANAGTVDPEGADEIAEAPEETTLPLTSSQMLAIEYLTQSIFDGSRSLTPRLHDEAVSLLLDAIQGETLQHQKLTNRVGSQRGMTGLLRRKLLQFLEFHGAMYHPERMLNRTPLEMVDERAALLSKLGRHREVLQLYALELQDAALAEAYCNRCYESKMADSFIYSTLLRLYLRPSMRTEGPGASPPLRGGSTIARASKEAVNAAINVLNKYAERIDVPTALDLLPPDVPAASLATFFRGVLERRVERFRNGQVKKQLAKMENFKVRELLSSKRKGSVTVWSSQICQSCGKKLGVGTFVRLPSGPLLHYSCQPVP